MGKNNKIRFNFYQLSEDRLLDKVDFEGDTDNLFSKSGKEYDNFIIADKLFTYARNSQESDEEKLINGFDRKEGVYAKLRHNNAMSKKIRSPIKSEVRHFEFFLDNVTFYNEYTQLCNLEELLNQEVDVEGSSKYLHSIRQAAKKDIKRNELSISNSDVDSYILERIAMAKRNLAVNIGGFSQELSRRVSGEEKNFFRESFSIFVEDTAFEGLVRIKDQYSDVFDKEDVSVLNQIIKSDFTSEKVKKMAEKIKNYSRRCTGGLSKINEKRNVLRHSQKNRDGDLINGGNPRSVGEISEDIFEKFGSFLQMGSDKSILKEVAKLEEALENDIKEYKERATKEKIQVNEMEIPQFGGGLNTNLQVFRPVALKPARKSLFADRVKEPASSAEHSI